MTTRSQPAMQTAGWSCALGGRSRRQRSIRAADTSRAAGSATWLQRRSRTRSFRACCCSQRAHDAAKCSRRHAGIARGRGLHRRVRAVAAHGRDRGRLRATSIRLRVRGVSLSSASTSNCWRPPRATWARCGKTTAVSFADVTVGLCRLHDVMRNLSAACRAPTRHAAAGPPRLLMPMPGRAAHLRPGDGGGLLPPRRLGRLERRSRHCQ